MSFKITVSELLDGSLRDKINHLLSVKVNVDTSMKILQLVKAVQNAEATYTKELSVIAEKYVTKAKGKFLSNSEGFPKFKKSKEGEGKKAYVVLLSKTHEFDFDKLSLKELTANPVSTNELILLTAGLGRFVEGDIK